MSDFNFGDMLGMLHDKLAKHGEIQEKKRLEQRCIGESGAGKVKVTLDGNYKVISIEIEEELWGEMVKDTGDTTKKTSVILCDLIKAACNAAVEEVAKLPNKELFPDNLDKMLKKSLFTNNDDGQS